MLILFTGKSRISCSFLHAWQMVRTWPDFAHFETFRLPRQSPENHPFALT